MADTDDDALSWAGDEQQAAKPPQSVDRPQRVELVETSPDAKPQLPAALLVTYGIVVGAFLLYTFGWVFSILGYNDQYLTSTEPLNAFMFGLGEILAIASPALWFIAAFVTTRGRKPLVRLLALVVGLVVVLPWPFVLGVWS